MVVMKQAPKVRESITHVSIINCSREWSMTDLATESDEPCTLGSDKASVQAVQS